MTTTPAQPAQGPYRVDDTKYFGEWIEAADGTIVARVYDRSPATARLLAASWEMREILKAVDHTLFVHGKVDGETPLHERIRDVLQKCEAAP